MREQAASITSYTDILSKLLATKSYCFYYMASYVEPLGVKRKLAYVIIFLLVIG